VGDRLADRLAGRRILLTGATGFLGEALLARLLVDLLLARPVLLVRPRPGQSGRDRVRGLLDKPAFRALRESGADLDAVLDEQVTVLEGDLAAIPPLPDDLDLVVHCAGDVSFDPAIDEGFATNVWGSRRLTDAAASAASGRPLHYVHVSTAYVAGLRRGIALEGRLDHQVDWRAEAAAAARHRDAVEDASRSSTRLAGFTRESQRLHGRSGPQAVAEEADRRRTSWVNDQLVAAGRERARSLGWTDCYTFTKAMAERAVEEAAGELRLSVFRPSIIESALRQPFPGWIEGFKMAEPLILAYGRGELPDFPAVPDGVLDVIPVDIVVNALLAVMATPPDPGRPAYVHCSSGMRNPLTFHEMYRHVRGYFEQHPLERRDRGAIAIPAWRFPGVERVEAMLRRAERLQDLTDRAVGYLPRSDRLRESVRSLDRQKARLEFLRRYADLYRPYTEAELLFDDASLRALLAAQHPQDRESFGFDPCEIDWRSYLQEVHCPSVTSVLRARSARSGTPAGHGTPDLPERSDVVAVFDLEGTLLPSNVVEAYLWLRLADAGALSAARELADVARSVPGYLAADRRNRAAMLRAVYRRYSGADPHELDRIVDEDLAPLLLGRFSAAAARRIRAHRAAGHRTVLVTGAVRALTRPLAPLFDEVVAVELAVGDDGRCNGFLVAPPLVGEARASWLRHHAAVTGADLAGSYAYGDSASDLPMLRAVGNPTVVNPDLALTRTARSRRWPIEHWRPSEAPSRALPRRALERVP
jgi:HAD superfamily hydrolase (TIGR01490 family)